MQPHLALFLFLSTMLFAGTPVASGGDGGEIFTQVKSPPPRGYLGVYTQDMTADLARSMKVKTEEGALVTEVMEDAPAEKAGLQNEDIIVGFDGKQISDARDLTDAVRKTAPGTRIDLVVMRKDEKKTLQAELGKTRRRALSGVAPIPPIPPHAVVLNLHQSLGLRVREISDQLAKYFDAPTDEAVLVEEVKEKSDAATAGIIAGDVILKVGEKAVEDVRDFRRSLRDVKEGDKVNIEVLRKGTRKSITVNVTDTPGERHMYNPPHGENFFFHHDPDFDTDFDFDFDFDIDVDVEGLEEGMEELHHELEGLGGRIKKELKRAKEELKSIKRWT